MKRLIFSIIILTTVNSFAQEKPDFRNDYYNKKRTLQESILKQEGAIIIFGNSLTEQGLWSEYFPNKNILNRGIGGDILCGMIDRLPDIMENKPTKIFITAGINDILFYNISKEQFEEWYSRIIDIVLEKQPDCTIYLESLLPVNNKVNPSATFLNKKNGTIKDFNSTIREIAKKYNLTYIDVHPKLLKDGSLNADYTSDGIHLNEKGYLIWTSILKPYIYE